MRHGIERMPHSTEWINHILTEFIYDTINPMKIIGLTGSIGMGKSVAAAQWRMLSVPVHDSDAVVHRLMQPDGAAFNVIALHFPEVIEDGCINRKKLGQIVFHDPEQRKILEEIIHPLVKQSSIRFINHCRRKRTKICVLDIPLLYEIGRHTEMDEIMTVTAPQWVQRRRVLKRPNMTDDKYKSIVKMQIPDYRKRQLSDYVVFTARGKRHSLNGIKKIKSKNK